MTTDTDTLNTRAHLLFMALKDTMIELESRGFRPELVTHPNGMCDRFGIYPGYATTPQVDAIRAKKVHGEQHKCT